MKKNSSTIVLPENPFWKVFKRFGRDEIIALFFNVIGTAIIAVVISKNAEMTEKMQVLLISLAGPIIEKIGFYPAHLWGGFTEWKADRTKKLGKCMWKSVKNGSLSLIEDLLIHDPVYILLMLGGQAIYAGTPAWILAFVSFIIAVIVVSFLEVAVIELGFIRFKKKIKNIFPRKEKYLESRFVINAEINPNDFIQKLSERFELTSLKHYFFQDSYYKPKLYNFNGRRGKIRKRTFRLAGEVTDRFQIIYTKAGEIPQNVLTQYRFFINLKEKFSMSLTEGQDIHNDSRLRYHDNKIHSTVEFERHSAQNPSKEGLYAAIDKVTSSTEEDYSLIELKVYEKNEKLLKTAMQYIMDEFNVLQTTRSKTDLK